MELELLGICPGCGIAVWGGSNCYYDESSDNYWHRNCLPDNEESVGYE